MIYIAPTSGKNRDVHSALQRRTDRVIFISRLQKYIFQLVQNSL